MKMRSVSENSSMFNVCCTFSLQAQVYFNKAIKFIIKTLSCSWNFESKATKKCNIRKEANIGLVNQFHAIPNLNSQSLAEISMPCKKNKKTQNCIKMIPEAFIKAKQSTKLLGLILASIACYSLQIIEV